MMQFVGDNLLAKRKGEKHKRIKCSTLARLLTEQNFEESIYNLNENSPSVMHADPTEPSVKGGREESIMGLMHTGQNNVPNADTKS